MKQVSVTIGIPTYEAGESLYRTIASIYSQTAFDAVREILVVVDGGKISPAVFQKIKNPKLSIVTKAAREGQSARINDILSMGKTPLIVLTNDDVVWAKDTLEHLLTTYGKTKADCISGYVTAAEPASFLEYILNAGSRLSYDISQEWNGGDNYLSFNGRLLMLSRRFAHSFSIPSSVWNNDAYIYCKAKEGGFSVAHARDARCFFRNPSRFYEYLRQSQKFAHSRADIQPYFSFHLTSLYTIPKSILVFQTMKHVLKNPFLIVLYFFFHVLTGFSRMVVSHTHQTSYWETDHSTKRIKVTM